MAADSMEVHEGLIRRFLERYGQALSAGDLRVVADCWDVPAFVISDGGAASVTSASEIERFFGGAVEWYRAQGLVSTKPEVERVERLSARLFGVDARWPAFDAAGNERASDHSRYILRLGDDGELHIRVAVTLGDTQ